MSSQNPETLFESLKGWKSLASSLPASKSRRDKDGRTGERGENEFGGWRARGANDLGGKRPGWLIFFFFFGALKACVFIVCLCLVCHGNLWENTLSRCLLTQGECKPDDVSVGVCVTKRQLNSLLLLLYNIMKTLDGEFNWEIIVILMN